MPGADSPSALQARHVRDDEYVTHYGSRVTGEAVFWDRPRPRDRDGVSVIVGNLTPAEARPLVRREGAPTEDDGVRHVLVGDLRALGFEVTHTPRPRDTRHVSIRYSEEWDDQVAGMFHSCWSKPQWHGDPEGGPDE